MIIETNTFSKLLEKLILNSTTEQGGILGVRDGVVVDIFFDNNASCSKVTYRPDVHALNMHLRNEWEPQGISFGGIFHTHLSGSAEFTDEDIEYASAIARSFPDTELWFPVIAVPDVIVEIYRVLYDSLADEVFIDKTNIE